MIVYNPYNEKISNARLKEAEELLAQIPAKYCFITGSFLHKEKYRDIDIFVVTRSKKEIIKKNKRVKIAIIDFNDLYSIFYHSVSKSCIAKNILPKKPLKITLSDYWQVINEAIPTLLNEKNRFHKNIRSLVLYTEYFKTGVVLDTFELDKKINSFKNHYKVMEYVKQELPGIFNGHAKQSYVKRFFYTQAGHYKEIKEYTAQNFLYELAHNIVRGITHG